MAQVNYKYLFCASLRRSQEGSSWIFGCWGGSRFTWQYKNGQNSGRLKGRCDLCVVCWRALYFFDRSLLMHWSWLTVFRKLWSQQLSITVFALLIQLVYNLKEKVVTIVAGFVWLWKNIFNVCVLLEVVTDNCRIWRDWLWLVSHLRSFIPQSFHSMTGLIIQYFNK